MRVTDKMLFDQATSRSLSARARAEKAVSQAATGLRVSHPGDDPAAAGMIVSRRAENVRLRAIEETTSRASDELIASDRALGGVLDLVVRAKELALQLGNDTVGAEERAAAAVEVAGLRRDAIIQLNTKVGDRYIFGGFLDGQTPFQDDGSFRGDTNVRQVEVAPGIYEAASVRADLYVQGTTTPPGVDILAALDELAQALNTNDGETARARVAQLDSGISQIAQARAMAGTSMNILDIATSAANAARTEGQISLSKLEDVDIVEAAGKLALAQRALEATLTASAKSFELSLLKKMG